MGALTKYILLICERRLLGKHVGSGGENMMGLIYNRLQEHKNEVGDRGAASHVRKYTEVFKHKGTTLSELVL